MTNNGIFVQELEKGIKEYLGVKNVVLVSNGTMATMIAIKVLEIKKEIYVSPYSYISTISVPMWMGIKPKFIDLDEEWKGPALVTHAYGIPNLVNVKPVIYDACHAFTNKKLLKEGDISIVSFHATKIFQTIEGGAIITQDDKLAEKCRWMRNFGFNGSYKYFGVGINAKMSEFHAAMGLTRLPIIDKIKKRYDEIINMYNKAFGLDWKDVIYYPIFYSSEEQVLKAIKIFEKNHIYPRRYFYPSLNTIFGGKKCPVAEDKSSRVLCIPLYYELTKEDIKRVIKVTQSTL